MNSSSPFANRRLVGAIVVSGLLLVPLGVFGGSALARTNGPSAAQYQYKVTICHHTGSKKHPFHTITVSNRAVAAHMRNHHDTLGPCPVIPTTGQPSTKSASHDSDNDNDNDGGGHGPGHDNGHHGKS